MDKLIWHTEKRKINQLTPFDINPRQMSDKQKTELTKSLESFNLVEIPAIDIDNIIIAGHQRLKILQDIGRGEEEIDVRIPNRKLTDEEFKEYNLRSNKNTGDWDYDLLTNFNEEMLKDVGFDSQELDKMFNEESNSEEIELKAYNKTHILISFDPDKIHLISEALELIRNTKGIDYEQSSN